MLAGADQVRALLPYQDFVTCDENIKLQLNSFSTIDNKVTVVGVISSHLTGQFGVPQKIVFDSIFL